MAPVDHDRQLHRPARPKSLKALRAARTVRPVKSTSSTSTTTCPVRSMVMSVAASGSTGRSPMSSR